MTDEVLAHVERVKATMRQMDARTRRVAISAGVLDPRFAEWEAAESLHPWGGDPDWCEMCFHGDGDARCVRCGRSTGGPDVCECGDDQVIGPCAREEDRASEVSE